MKFHHYNRRCGNPMVTTRRRRFVHYEDEDGKKHDHDVVLLQPYSTTPPNVMKHYHDLHNCNANASRKKNNSLYPTTLARFNPAAFIAVAIMTIWLLSHQLSFFFTPWHESLLLSKSSSRGKYEKKRKQRQHYLRVISIQFPVYKYNESSRNDSMMIDPMLFVSPGEETEPQVVVNRKTESKNCVPMKQWQISNKPTCNLIHELDLQSISTKNEAASRHVSFNIVGNGWFRHTWKVHVGSMEEYFVLKTLRFEREFHNEYYELHRRESMAMERLTESPYIIDIFSFCAQTSINEYANFIDGFQDLWSFAKQLRGKNDNKVLRLKLLTATYVALGVKHIHEIDYSGGGDNATLVHYDINPKNVVVSKGGIPKINDFNLAEFMYWDKTEKKRCGFAGRFNEPWWRSPEEMRWSIYNNLKNHDDSKKELSPQRLDGKSTPLHEILCITAFIACLLIATTEKVDIYSLGNIIYVLLTGHSPRGRAMRDRTTKVKMELLDGVLPSMNDTIDTTINDETYTRHPIYVAMKDAMNKCFLTDPKKRSSARQIAQALLDILDETAEIY